MVSLTQINETDKPWVHDCEGCGEPVDFNEVSNRGILPTGDAIEYCGCEEGKALMQQRLEERIARAGIKPPARIAPAPARPEPTALDQMHEEARERRRLGQLSEYLTLLTDVDGLVGLPSAYTRTDGATIIPEGKISSIYGNPSCCKSWIMLDVARAVASTGARVLWWDFEDSKQSLLSRCHAIGFGPDDGLGNVGFIPPAVADDPGLVQQAALWVQQGSGPGLVVIDALASAGCPSDGSDIGPWWDAHVKPFGSGQTMVLGDHIPKRAEDRAPGAIGSTHKRSFLTGVSLLVDGQPWTKTEDGRVTLTNQKDRHSVLPAGPNRAVAVVVGQHVNGRLSLTVEPPNAKEQGAALADRVIHVLTQAEPNGIRTAVALAKAVGCKRQALDKVLPGMIEDGAIEKAKNGRADVYRVAREDTPF